MNKQMATKVVLDKKLKLEHRKEIFAWCAKHCSKEYGDGHWGTSWWTENNTTEFYFIDPRDAFAFQLKFGGAGWP